MKKLLLISLLFFTKFSYSQSEYNIFATTTTRFTCNMVWDDVKETFNFFENNDLDTIRVDWHFVLNIKKETGTITANGATFKVTSIKASEMENKQVVVTLKSFSTIKHNEVTFILARAKDGSLFIALFDEKLRRSYYFN